MSEQKQIPVLIKFPIAGISGMGAGLIVHPLDLIKNNMQLSGVGNHDRRSTVKTALAVFRNGGIQDLYLGLSAGLLRQSTYGSCRVGTYMWLLDSYNNKHKTQPGFHMKLTFGCLAGICGSIVGTPSEVVLIRMTADSRLPMESRRNYSNAISAIMRITKEEGILTLWRGFSATMARAIVANAAELTAYSEMKQYLLSTSIFTDNITTHFTSSIVAALTNISISLPIDIAKTRIQTMKIINGQPEYKGPFDVVKKIIKNEGLTALWKGFTPSFACIGPRTVLVFVFVENLCKIYSIYVLNETENPISGL